MLPRDKPFTCCLVVLWLPIDFDPAEHRQPSDRWGELVEPNNLGTSFVPRRAMRKAVYVQNSCSGKLLRFSLHPSCFSKPISMKKKKSSSQLLSKTHLDEEKKAYFFCGKIANLRAAISFYLDFSEYESCTSRSVTIFYKARLNLKKN